NGAPCAASSAPPHQRTGLTAYSCPIGKGNVKNMIFPSKNLVVSDFCRTFAEKTEAATLFVSLVEYSFVRSLQARQGGEAAGEEKPAGGTASVLQGDEAPSLDSKVLHSQCLILNS
ncbi:MAG: hypothetical protein J6T64_05745, partial [Bacteroidaceae bacterium]|nr:hypothetical protein [Bacteroidaceae bacterium]